MHPFDATTIKNINRVNNINILNIRNYGGNQHTYFDLTHLKTHPSACKSHNACQLFCQSLIQNFSQSRVLYFIF